MRWPQQNEYVFVTWTYIKFNELENISMLCRFKSFVCIFLSYVVSSIGERERYVYAAANASSSWEYQEFSYCKATETFEMCDKEETYVYGEIEKVVSYFKSWKNKYIIDVRECNSKLDKILL